MDLDQNPASMVDVWQVVYSHLIFRCFQGADLILLNHAAGLTIRIEKLGPLSLLPGLRYYPASWVSCYCSLQLIFQKNNFIRSDVIKFTHTHFPFHLSKKVFLFNGSQNTLPQESFLSLHICKLPSSESKFNTYVWNTIILSESIDT